MSQFIQLHLLTSYAPANLNRDDLGRPKTAIMGGFERLRVSSQSLKRHWRTSESFANTPNLHIGIRTKRFGHTLFDAFIEAGTEEKKAKEWTIMLLEKYGKIKKNTKSKKTDSTHAHADLELEQLVHLSPQEQKIALSLVQKLADEDRPPQKEELTLLQTEKTSVDIALFGRMLASSPKFTIEAACQVAHAISVHSVVIEDDYFTAVDDLNAGTKETGSAHIGEAGFAAGLFYSYLCLNKTQLVSNLGGDVELANHAIRALAEAAATVAPTGKQNSFATRSYASYMLAEKGPQQPRSLAVAFLKPISSADMLADTIHALEKQVQYFDQAYAPCADDRYHFTVHKGHGSLSELLNFVEK